MLAKFFSRLGSDLAIDLGTANTLIGVPGRGLVLDEPSVVAVAEDSRRVLANGCAVGHLARQLLGRTPQSIDVIRPLQDGVIADYTLCEAMLRYFLRKTRHNRWQAKPRVLIAVPGCITPVEKRAVYNSAQRAGARQVLLISEAKAAAIGVGLPVIEPVASMVCDIGGGTTDIAVFSLGDQVAGQSIRVGGDAMDRAIVEYLRRQHALKIGIPMAERLRIDIGSAYPLAKELTAEVRGVDAANNMPRKLTISSEEIREALTIPLQTIAEAVRQTIDDTPVDLASDLVDNGMVLCGGGAMLRSMDRYLSAQTGIPTRLYAEPLIAAARGALICLEHLDRWRSGIESSDDDA
jgi:rod shape-determining protein MreB